MHIPTNSIHPVALVASTASNKRNLFPLGYSPRKIIPDRLFSPPNPQSKV
jgi:hypothetical protein